MAAHGARLILLTPPPFDPVPLRAGGQLRPADADALANLGNIRLLQHRPAEAIRLYESALRLRPGDARTAENLQLARTQLATP